MIEKLVRKNLLDLVPYSSARDENKNTSAILLDANESPEGQYNRYPNPLSSNLRNEIAKLQNCSIQNLLLGNGSDEVLDWVVRLFCTPGKDNVIICEPTYGMYEIIAKINDVEVKKVPLNKEFQLDIPKIKNKVDSFTKIIFVCSPNNPTGNLMKNINELLSIPNVIVLVDEAYIDFSNAVSMSTMINTYWNLIICKTMSKAYGMAGLRIGMAIANKEIIDWMRKIKSPYNISSANEQTTLNALENFNLSKRVNEIIKERERLIAELIKNKLVIKIYPSDTNFLLVEFEDYLEVFEFLKEQNIVVRNRNKDVANTLRITVGTKEENNLLIQQLYTIQSKKLTNKYNKIKI